MATYFNDCSSVTGWSERIKTGRGWASSGGSIEIVAAGATDWNYLTLGEVEDSNHANVEILAKYTTPSSLSSARHPLVVRGAGSDESATGYSIRVSSSSIRIYSCKASDTPVQVATAAFTFNTSTTYWIRFRANSTSLKARVWADGGGEPGTWNIDVTDGTISDAGWNGLSDYSTTTNGGTVDQIGFGTNGDTAPSSAGGGATIAGDSLTHAHSLSSPSLTQSNVLAVQGVAQSHSLGAPALTQHNVLAVNAIAQAHALGNVTLTQAHILTVQGIGQAHSLGAPSLTQHNALTPAPLTQAQTLGNVTLTIAGSIAAANIAQGHSIGTPALTQHHVLTVAALMQAQSLGQPALAQAGTLAVDGMTQAQVLDAVALVQHHALAVQALLQGHALGNVTLTASDALAIDGLTHAQILGSPSLTQHNVLAVQNMTHAQILQAVTLGGLVIGSLRGTLVAYSLLDGEVVCRALLSGSLETVH